MNNVKHYIYVVMLLSARLATRGAQSGGVHLSMPQTRHEIGLELFSSSPMCLPLVHSYCPPSVLQQKQCIHARGHAGSPASWRKLFFFCVIPWRWRQQVFPKLLYLYYKLHLQFVSFIHKHICLNVLYWFESLYKQNYCRTSIENFTLYSPCISV